MDPIIEVVPWTSKDCRETADVIVPVTTPVDEISICQAPLSSVPV